MQTHSNDPRHLGTPGQMPVLASFGCECCGTGYSRSTDLKRFGGKFACQPCIQAGHCKDCLDAWAADGADECTACSIKFYVATPAEFDDALPVLRQSYWGQRIIHQVLVRRVNAAMEASDYEAASAALQLVIQHRVAA
jgi:hypothetical protein